MMPGSEPYSDAELRHLPRLVADASEGDPGELAEPFYVREAIVTYGPRRALPGTPVTSSRDVEPLVRELIGDRVTENFLAIALDARNRPIAWSTIAVGSTSACPVSAASVFRFAILAGAVSVLVAHNHPSGDETPSADDVALTERLVRAGELLGVRVLDHVVIGEGSSYSFLDSGRMPRGVE